MLYGVREYAETAGLMSYEIDLKIPLSLLQRADLVIE